MAYYILVTTFILTCSIYISQLLYKKLALAYCKLLFFSFHQVLDIKKTYYMAFRHSNIILKRLLKHALTIIDHNYCDFNLYEKCFHAIEKLLPFDEVRLTHHMMLYDGSLSNFVQEFIVQEEKALKRYVYTTLIACLKVSISFLLSTLIYSKLTILGCHLEFQLLPLFNVISSYNFYILIFTLLLFAIILTMPLVIKRHPSLDCASLLWLITFSSLLKQNSLEDAFALSVQTVKGDFLKHVQDIKHQIIKEPHTVEPLSYVMKYFKDLNFQESKTINLSPLIVTPYLLIFVIIIIQLITDPALEYLWLWGT